MTDAATPALDRLADEFFTVQHRHDPLNATLLGLGEFDGLLPDLNRAADIAAAERFRGLAEAAASVPTTEAREDIDRAVLVWMANAAADDAHHRLWEANASAAGYVSPQALVFQAVPATPQPDDAARAGLLQRLAGLPEHFDTLADRYREAAAEGRVPTAVGVRQAATQLENYLARPLETDALLPAGLGDRRAAAAVIVEQQVRPAMARLADALRTELLSVARGDDAVGIGAVPGGAEGYRAAVARHTSLDRTPQQIHQTGLDVLAALHDQWATIGREALGLTDPAEIRARLAVGPGAAVPEPGADPGHRHRGAGPGRGAPHGDAAALRDRRLHGLRDRSRGGGQRRARLLPPPFRRRRTAGAHCVLTADPGARFRFEYEALAFHESVPGHHLQLASAQTLGHLPRYRRHVDTQLCAYIEGWGLYAERLADEFGLYSSPTTRLGMLSFDALRACRLVVDTGMHALGWSRTQAMAFMREQTATPEANIRNEIDRYIAWPGQALAYMTGRHEIERLRERSRAELGDAFTLPAFHGAVLGEGPLPLRVLDTVVSTWSRAQRTA